MFQTLNNHKKKNIRVVVPTPGSTDRGELAAWATSSFTNHLGWSVPTVLEPGWKDDWTG
jgi:hypothetical protein